MTRLTTKRANRRNLKSKYCLTVVSNYFPNHFDGGFSHGDKKEKRYSRKLPEKDTVPLRKVITMYLGGKSLFRATSKDGPDECTM